MRLVVLALALLAGAKIWFQDSLFRAGAEEALVAAYKARAVEACRKAPLKEAQPAGLTESADWARARSVSMSAGNRRLAVHLWQTDHPLWNARFRNPHLLLATGEQGSGGIACSYDVLTGEASLERL